MKENKHPIYLDHNATTPLLPEVVEAMLPYLTDHFGNPSSGHVYGQRVKEAVESARRQVASLIGAEASEIFFTSGGTEANNLAIRGSVRADRERKRIVTSVIEHPATEAPCRLLEKHGFDVTRMGVDRTGRVSEARIEEAVDDRCALITLMHANNETGTIQPITEAARMARAVGTVTHTDAAQSVGKVEIHVDELGVDLLSIAGHKLYAPKGVGALYIRKGTKITPVLRGAGHEHGLRPGTENVASIVGLGAACAIAESTMSEESSRVNTLRDKLWELLKSRIPGVELNGHETERLPNTLNVRFPGVRGSVVLAQAPEVAASTGSACHEGGESASSVLLATGLTDEEALGAVRLSLGRGTSLDDVYRAAESLVLAWRQLELNR